MQRYWASASRRAQAVNDLPALVESNQQQAVASWVNYLNQLRIDQLLSSFRQQDGNFLQALGSIDAAMQKIELEVVGTNRGGQHGMHGFIAEIAEVGMGNARKLIQGQAPVYQWVNDNGPVDLMRSGVEIQQKFVASGGRFSLGAIAEHLQRYPDFVQNGGKYQIPSDHFDMIQRLHAMSAEEAGRTLSRSNRGPSFTDWQRINTVFTQGDLGIESLEASALKYPEAQRGAYHSTMAAEKDSLLATDQSLRENAYQESLPTLREGASATLAAAVIEGATAFVLAVVAKRREGHRLNDFSQQDWLDVAGKTGFGFATGGVRGASIYTLTNFTATPAAVASSMVTAGFSIAQQANKFRAGEIDELEFIQNSEVMALQAAVSALSSFVGQAVIPVPVLGAVIGNTVGTVMFSAVASALSAREAEVIERYLAEQRALDRDLAAELQELLATLNHSMSDYLGLLERAFSPDVQVALLGSAELALELGVAAEEILDSDEKIHSYFLD